MGEVPILLSRPRMSSEIQAMGEREVRISKRFRHRLNTLTPRDMLTTVVAAHHMTIVP